MKTTWTKRCDTYDEAVTAKEKAAMTAQQSFGGKVEKDWKVRIRYRKAGHFDVKTYRYVEPPKPKADDGSVDQQDRSAFS